MSSTFANLTITVILAVILFFAIRSSIAHFKGKGACCGGGGSDVKVKPRKIDNVISVKVMKIDGMHCEHCYTRVQNALNSIDGVSAKVMGKKGRAVIRMGKKIDDEVLMSTVNELGYTAVSIVDE